MENIALLNGLLVCKYNLGTAQVTLFHNISGKLKWFVVDDGLEIREYAYKGNNTHG